MGDFQDLQSYTTALPFPHAVVDGCFDPELVRMAELEFPGHEHPCWARFNNARELKDMCQDAGVMGPATRRLLEVMVSADFSANLEEMTGIRKLIPDMIGGGMHLTPPGGKLGIHTDFNVGSSGHRRLNTLLFLNSEWDAQEWGGELELWSADKSLRKMVSPIANRLVVFTTSEISFHGHPYPLRCPEGRSRKSLAVYFFTAAAPENAAAPHSTVFLE